MSQTNEKKATTKDEKTPHNIISDMVKDNELNWGMQSLVLSVLSNYVSEFNDEERDAIKSYSDALLKMLEVFSKEEKENE